MKVFNLKTKKTENLFETLNPVYQIRYSNPIYGNIDEFVVITLEADDEKQAKIKAMNNQEFTSHIEGKHYDIEYLTAFKPKGLYVIGKVEYYEGVPRL
jgi:hypothetical protein